MDQDGKRIGDWCQTISGVMMYPLDPRPEEIIIDDIAHALSMQCRFGGHVKDFYSVAEHSVRVSNELPSHLALWGLLHDAAEAYLIDLPRPIKRFSDIGRLYSKIEDNLMRVICQKFGLPEQMPLEVHQMDDILLATERRDLTCSVPKPWEDDGTAPLATKISPWRPYWAKINFLKRFEFLTTGSDRLLTDRNSGKQQPFEYTPD